MSATLGPPLPTCFFDRPPREVARDLIGCTLLHAGVGGRIVETEAYERDDPACHAYGGPTPRNAPLFGPPACAYVYLCYGIHSMFNLVTAGDGTAAAVLIRALEPTHGLAHMRSRRPGRGARELCSGPGKLCQALSIEVSQSGEPALEEPFSITGRTSRTGETSGAPASELNIVTGPRIGLTRAAELPWRYCLGDSPHLSAPAG